MWPNEAVGKKSVHDKRIFSSIIKGKQHKLQNIILHMLANTNIPLHGHSFLQNVAYKYDQGQSRLGNTT